MRESKVKWPGGARCAVMLSFDMDGETTWRNGNADFEHGADFIRSLTVGQYGPIRGVPRIVDLLERHNLKATFFVPGWVAEHYPDTFKAVAKAGHELGDHGYTHERFVDLSYEEQKAIMLKSRGIFEKLTGKRAAGFRSPSGDWSSETPGLLEELGFKYSSSMRGDDRPYRTLINGKTTGLIEIPAHWELDDYVQMAYNFYPAEPSGQGRVSGLGHVFDNFKREFDGYYRLGLCYVLMMHPQVIGKPGRIMMLEKLIQHMKTYPDVWFATGSEIADWWLENY